MRMQTRSPDYQHHLISPDENTHLKEQIAAMQASDTQLEEVSTLHTLSPPIAVSFLIVYAPDSYPTSSPYPQFCTKLHAFRLPALPIGAQDADG